MSILPDLIQPDVFKLWLFCAVTKPFEETWACVKCDCFLKVITIFATTDIRIFFSPPKNKIRHIYSILEHYGLVSSVSFVIVTSVLLTTFRCRKIPGLCFFRFFFAADWVLLSETQWPGEGEAVSAIPHPDSARYRTSTSTTSPPESPTRWHHLLVHTTCNDSLN